MKRTKTNPLNTSNRLFKERESEVRAPQGESDCETPALDYRSRDLQGLNTHPLTFRIEYARNHINICFNCTDRS